MHAVQKHIRIISFIKTLVGVTLVGVCDHGNHHYYIFFVTNSIFFPDSVKIITVMLA